MVDYRSLPRVDRPELLSPSRVVLRIGPDLWAVELGSYVSQKYRLSADRLPSELRQRTGAGDEASGEEPANARADADTSASGIDRRGP
jgi:hypothetical protein